MNTRTLYQESVDTIPVIKTDEKWYDVEFVTTSKSIHLNQRMDELIERMSFEEMIL